MVVFNNNLFIQRCSIQQNQDKEHWNSGHGLRRATEIIITGFLMPKPNCNKLNKLTLFFKLSYTNML